MTQAADEKIPFYRNWHELIKPEKLEVDRAKHTDSYGKFVCEPLERGFAVTIGNSLRRILLSSIQGAAITSIKIEGALHEFTSMKDIMEDVSEIILNVKMVRIKLHSGDSQQVVIDKSGPGTVPSPVRLYLELSLLLSGGRGISLLNCRIRKISLLDRFLLMPYLLRSK